MKTIKFVAYLFYRYYSTTKGFAKDIPYAATLGALVLLAYLHIFQIFALLNITNLIPTNGSQMKVSNYFIMGLFMLPVLIFFFAIIKKRELQRLQYDDKRIKRGYIYLIGYIILSFSFLMLLAIFRK
ncbi:MAG: hypothetical protein Q8941_15960 [Bacteroidota bacterium]|nr:hypothetical protein [Bacteroidota bacterium]